MTYHFKLNGLRFLLALLLGLLLVFGVHASTTLATDEQDRDAWPVRIVPKTTCG